MFRSATLLIVLGTILGPAYYGYCEYLSGEPLQDLTVSERADRWSLPDGEILRFRAGLAYRPVEIALDPQLNRLRVGLTLEFPPGGQTGEVEYLATLLYGDHPLLEQTVRVPQAGKPSVTLRSFEVPAPDAYIFLLEEVGPPRPAATVTVHLRGGIAPLFRPLMWFGVALLLAGLALLTYSLVAAPGARNKR
jgi:hypothetical protein